MSTAPQLWGGVLKEVHCPLLPNSVAVYRRSPTALCSTAVWHCTATVALPTAPHGCGNELRGVHCPLLPSGVAVY